MAMLPTRINKTSFIAISSFSNASVGVTSDGDVVSWGSNAKGRLG